MNKKLLLMLCLALMNISFVKAQKTVYIPYEWRMNRTDTLLYAENDLATSKTSY